MAKNKVTFDIDGELIEIDVKEKPPYEFSSWYQQFLELDSKSRDKIASQVLLQVKKAKPQTIEFIKKFKCELVGISPRLEYALTNTNEMTTWVHSFAGPTLLFWCESGGFGFFVNAILDYNDTVLNKLAGNKKDKSISGFTG